MNKLVLLLTVGFLAAPACAEHTDDVAVKAPGPVADMPVEKTVHHYKKHTTKSKAELVKECGDRLAAAEKMVGEMSGDAKAEASVHLSLMKTANDELNKADEKDRGVLDLAVSSCMWNSNKLTMHHKKAMADKAKADKKAAAEKAKEEKKADTAKKKEEAGAKKEEAKAGKEEKKADAEKSKADAEKAKADADKAKADADKAKADADAKAKK